MDRQDSLHFRFLSMLAVDRAIPQSANHLARVLPDNPPRRQRSREDLVTGAVRYRKIPAGELRRHCGYRFYGE